MKRETQRIIFRIGLAVLTGGISEVIYVEPKEDYSELTEKIKEIGEEWKKERHERYGLGK